MSSSAYIKLVGLAVGGLVSALIAAGMPRKYAPLVSVAAGAALAALQAHFGLHKSPVDWVNALTTGMILGASGTGLSLAIPQAALPVKAGYRASRAAATAVRDAAVRAVKSHQTAVVEATPPGQE